MDNGMRHAIRAAVAATALLAAASGVAQQPQPRDGTIARLTDVNGNVLVSREAGLASGNEALRLLPGTRVITTSNSEVVIEYDNGCRVRLKENQRFEVESGKPCALLIASPQAIIVAPAGVVVSHTPVLIGFGAAAAAILIDSRGGQSVSPN
jgi:hypothetical protein